MPPLGSALCTNAVEVSDSDPTRPDRPIDSPEVNLLEYLPLVRSLAAKVYASLPPYASVELNDLVQAGHLGLVNAGRAYQSGRGVPFAVYARFRIRGEILDSLRHIDTASRRVRKMEKRIRAARTELAAGLQRDPTDGEVVEQLQRTAEPATKIDLSLLRLPPMTITSLDDRDAGTEDWRSPGPGPESLRSEGEARHLLLQALARLPSRSRELIQLYYQGEMTMREIGLKFGVNESRVSQIHRRALEHLARYLRGVGVGSAREI